MFCLFGFVSGLFQLVLTHHGLSWFVLFFTNDEFIKMFDLQIYKNQCHVSFYYKVRQALLQTVTALMYCKVGQLLLQMQMVQIFCFTNWDKGSYKVRLVVQNGVGISKQGSFHDKVGQISDKYLVTICFQFYSEKSLFALNLKCSNLKTTMSFEHQHLSSIICKLVEFKIAEIHIPDTPLFSHPPENWVLL